MQKVHQKKYFERGQELVDLGLDLTICDECFQVTARSRCCRLVAEHMSEEELVNDLWTSHFNK